mgnify:CR=1 FL=1
MRLIDYTVAKEGSADNAATNTCYECLTQGINGSQDEGRHLLKFMFNRPDVSRATGRLKTIMASPLNTYTPSTAGFRYSTAKTDGGYPIVRDPASGLTESVRYLFDDSAQDGKKIVDKNVSPTMFTQDATSGNYVFDSEHTSAVYNRATHAMDAVEHSDGDSGRSTKSRKPSKPSQRSTITSASKSPAPSPPARTIRTDMAAIWYWTSQVMTICGSWSTACSWPPHPAVWIGNMPS